MILHEGIDQRQTVWRELWKAEIIYSWLKLGFDLNMNIQNSVFHVRHFSFQSGKNCLLSLPNTEITLTVQLKLALQTFKGICLSPLIPLGILSS